MPAGLRLCDCSGVPSGLVLCQRQCQPGAVPGRHLRGVHRPFALELLGPLPGGLLVRTRLDERDCNALQCGLLRLDAWRSCLHLQRRVPGLLLLQRGCNIAYLYALPRRQLWRRGGAHHERLLGPLPGGLHLRPRLDICHGLSLRAGFLLAGGRLRVQPVPGRNVRLDARALVKLMLGALRAGPLLRGRQRVRHGRAVPGRHAGRRCGPLNVGLRALPGRQLVRCWRNGRNRLPAGQLLPAGIQRANTMPKRDLVQCERSRSCIAGGRLYSGERCATLVNNVPDGLWLQRLHNARRFGRRAAGLYRLRRERRARFERRHCHCRQLL